MYTFIILCIIVGGAVVHGVVEALNLMHIHPTLPSAFEGHYDAETYARSQHYLRDNTLLDMTKTLVFTLLIIAMTLLGGFDVLDGMVRRLTGSPLNQGLLFIGCLAAASFIFSLPFQIIHTFVIEEKYGFNKTSVSTFMVDRIKGIVLGVLLGGLLLTGVLWFFETMGAHAWLVAWMGVMLFQLIIHIVAPIVIFPLFNRLTPLADGELKSAIERYAHAQNFKMKGLFTMDSSKRSTKGNAFFAGIGKFRRVVLFDTLIQKHTPEELVAVVAHEIGHFRKKHIIKQFILSIVSTGLMFYLLSVFINNEGLFEAFRMSHLSIYASLVFFGILYAPVSQLISLLSHYLSRKYEFEADAFSFRTYPKPGVLKSALIKLSIDNLSNLRPHPLKVFMDYTHPPILKRLEKLT